MSRGNREYGLIDADRKWVIRKNFGLFSSKKVLKLLDSVDNPSDKVLGAILFLARPDKLEDIVSLVELANENERRLLDSAQVKDDRT